MPTAARLRVLSGGSDQKAVVRAALTAQNQGMAQDKDEPTATERARAAAQAARERAEAAFGRSALGERAAGKETAREEASSEATEAAQEAFRAAQEALHELEARLSQSRDEPSLEEILASIRKIIADEERAEKQLALDTLSRIGGNPQGASATKSEVQVEERLTSIERDMARLKVGGTVVSVAAATILAAQFILWAKVGDLQESLGNTRAALTSDISNMRADLTRELNTTRTELTNTIADLRVELATVRVLLQQPQLRREEGLPPQ